MSIKITGQFQDARKKRKQQLRLERCMKKSYEKSLEKPPDVFTFLNNELSKCQIRVCGHCILNFLFISLFFYRYQKQLPR